MWHARFTAVQKFVCKLLKIETGFNVNYSLRDVFYNPGPNADSICFDNHSWIFMGIQVMKQHNSNKQEPIYNSLHSNLFCKPNYHWLQISSIHLGSIFFSKTKLEYGLMLDLFLICLIYILYPIAIFSTPAIPPSTHVIASLATSRDVVGTPEIG